MNGLLLLDKPSGITSRDAVDRVVHCFGERKIGHTGTLDPLASGLLVICLGKTTKLTPYIQEQKKTYEAAINLGACSTTDDAAGQITKTKDCPQPTKTKVAAALKKLTGTILQVPPQFSAAKAKGQRAYQLARQGKTVALAPRAVTISEITLLEYKFPTLQIKATVSKGTYIRALARDLGKQLGTGAFLSDLRRTQVGSFQVADAISCEDLEMTPKPDLKNLLRPSLQAVSHLPQLAIDETEAQKIRYGQTITPPQKMGPGPIALTFCGELLAVATYQKETKSLQPTLVFN